MSNPSEILKPCPFCGNEKPSFERLGTGRQSCIVECGQCGCRHESSDEYDRCGESWNTRALEGRPSLEMAPIELLRGERAVGYREGYEEALRHQTERSETAVQRPAGEEPRFSLSISDHGVQIWDDEPKYDDGCLRVSGNFDSFNQKIEFAREVLALLNSPPTASGNDATARSDSNETSKPTQPEGS